MPYLFAPRRRAVLEMNPWPEDSLGDFGSRLSKAVKHARKTVKKATPKPIVKAVQSVQHNPLAYTPAAPLAFAHAELKKTATGQAIEQATVGIALGVGSALTGLPLTMVEPFLGLGPKATAQALGQQTQSGLASFFGPMKNYVAPLAVGVGALFLVALLRKRKRR